MAMKRILVIAVAITAGVAVSAAVPNGDQAIVHVLNRVAFGPRPGDVDRVRSIGLERYIDARGLSLVRTQVGDRYVLERMRAGGFNLGGEQSGHIIMTDHATTGDGLMAALQALAALVRSGRPASETFRAFEPVPQLLKNVRVSDANAALNAAAVVAAIAAAEKKLGKSGRVLVRKSGTEPLIRVMAEGDDSQLVQSVVDQIIEAIPRQAA